LHLQLWVLAGSAQAAFTVPDGNPQTVSSNTISLRIFLDDGDGIFEPGQDTLCSPGVNDPVLAPDATTIAFVVNDTPSGLATGNTAAVQLTATASGLAR
jgi:hypothetical protein